MAKRKFKPKSGTSKSRKAPLDAPLSTATAVPPWHIPTAADDDTWRKRFWALSVVLGLILLALATNVGVNGDDVYQNDYSHKLLDWYTSFGENDAALNIEKGKMHYYGGLFDITAGTINSVLGFEENQEGYHTVRHLLNALFGILALVYTGLLARLFGGWKTGMLAMGLLFLSPRFLGHSLMNPKDIPFAAGFIVSIYYMVKYFRLMPAPDRRDLIGMAIGIGIAVGSRAGGLLLIAYLGLFSLVNLFLRNHKEFFVKYLLYGAAVSVGGFVLGILFWPFALVSPISHPLEALGEFSKLGVQIRVLFEGETWLTSDTAWYYPLSWVYRTIPPFALIGFLGGLVLLPKMWKRFPRTPLLLVLFAAVFPLLYIVIKDSLLHDGWRHLTFLYPTLLVFVTLFWTTLYQLFRDRRPIQYAVIAALILCALDPAQYIVRNPSYPYTYFSVLTGGIGSNYGYYETDYWGTSVKQAVEWLEDEGILHENMTDTVRLASSFSYNMNRYLDKKYRKMVKPMYIKYNARYKKDWDYAIFPSRYVRGPHIQSGNWLTDRALHTIEANGRPLTVILERRDDFVFEGEKAMAAKDFNRAIQQFQLEVEKYPKNEQAWIGLANAYAQTQQVQKSGEAAQRVLEIAPENVIAYYFQGFAELQRGETDKAEKTLREALKVNPQYSPANFYLAIIYRDRGDLRTALEFSNASWKHNGKFTQGKQLSAELQKAIQGGR